VPHGFEGTTPLHAAARVGSVPLMALICSDNTIGASCPMPPEGQGGILDDEARTVLAVAVAAGHVAAVRWLVFECGWDLDHETERMAVQHAFGQCPSGSRAEIRAVMESFGVSCDEVPLPGAVLEGVGVE
jgi:hypothetical protein